MKATAYYECSECKFTCCLYVYFDTRNRDDQAVPILCIKEVLRVAYWKPRRR